MGLKKKLNKICNIIATVSLFIVLLAMVVAFGFEIYLEQVAGLLR